MKRVVLGLLLCTSTAARAEAPTEVAPSPIRSRPEASLSPLRLDEADLARVERRARYRRNVGIGLSVPGVTLLVVGAVLIGAGAHDPRLATGAAEIAAGSIALGTGVVFTIPGTLLWIGGQDDLDLAAWRRSRLSLPTR